MKVVFKGEHGTLTWEPTRDAIRSLKEQKISEGQQTKALHGMFKSTADFLSGLIAVGNYGYPGTARLFTALLDEMGSNKRRLVSNYLNLHSYEV